MLNGSGLRVVLWLSGCSHHCYNCQNPQTWNPNDGIPFDESAKAEIYDRLSKDYISGITFSGGDPLHENNLVGVYNLIEKIRVLFPNKTIWLYSGFRWIEIMSPPGIECLNHKRDIQNIMRQQIVKMCDVLVDGRYIDEQRDVILCWKGSENQQVINVKRTLESGGIVLWE